MRKGLTLESTPDLTMAVDAELRLRHGNRTRPPTPNRRDCGGHWPDAGRGAVPRRTRTVARMRELEAFRQTLNTALDECDRALRLKEAVGRPVIDRLGDQSE